MNARRILLFFLIILALAIFSILYPSLQTLTGHATSANNYYPKETAILERVIDGDTIVYRIGNISQHCRLLGINNTKV